MPAQTVNVDLCFVPAIHATDAVVPAVSGSSGRLVVSHAPHADAERTWPGRVFASAERSYPEAMDQFVAARRAAVAAKATETTGGEGDEVSAGAKAQRQALRSDWQRLETSRRAERARRQLTDRAWQVCQHAHADQAAVVRKDRLAGRMGWKIQAGAIQAHWRAQWAERHREFAERRARDVQWRVQRQDLRARQAAAGSARGWIAILVIVDNCTRRCLGLPVFALSAHVTADLVVAALRAILPRELAYLIADGGSHFTGAALAELATARGFVRVPLATHRPQSNGIAERFIETLKDWLARTPWDTPNDLTLLLAQFLPAYNDRPHQGIELAGLSPNEYAARMTVI